MGSAAAYWLSKSSELKIVLVERYSIGNDYCSSHDANRVFRYSYGADKLYTRMAMNTLPLWKSLEADTGEQLLVPSGLLLVQGNNEESNRFNDDSYRTLREMSLAVEELDGPDLKKKFPQFNAVQAYLDPYGGVLLASKILATLSESARKRGTRVLENRRVTKLNPRDDVEIETSGGIVRARKVIVTIGPWSNALRSERLAQITPTRQQIVYFQPGDLSQYRPGRFPVFFADQYYGIPAAGIDAVKVSNKGLPDPVDPESANRSVDLGMGAICREVCGRFIPSLANAPIHLSKVCLYDMAPNSDFIIAKDPEHANVIYGYGFSGHGFKFAPLIGRLLADLVQNLPPSFDLERFTPREG
jgi:sarcosine oxidase